MHDADNCAPVEKKLTVRKTNKKEGEALPPPTGNKKHKPALITQGQDEVGDQTQGHSERTSVTVGTSKAVLRRLSIRNGQRVRVHEN